MEHIPDKTTNAAGVVALGLMCAVVPALLRAILCLKYGAELVDETWRCFAYAFWVGLRLDGVVAGYVMLPICLLIPWQAQWAARLSSTYATCAVVALSFALVFDYAFIDYYGFRANYLVLEHGSDREVISAVLSGYLRPGLLLALIISIMFCLSIFRGLRNALGQPMSRHIPGPRRRILTAISMTGIAFLAGRGTLDHRPLNPSLAAIGTNRLLNEIAGSGLLNVARATVHNMQKQTVLLDSIHTPLPRPEAIDRVKRLLKDSGRILGGPANPFIRQTPNRRNDKTPLNVVLVIMESFTGRLVGSLGGDPALSPEFDELTKEGLLLTHCYATGGRTVQGLEAVVSSFPPLPGTSVVRRPEARGGFETLASVLQRSGYDTLFLYGGQGIFDDMRGFFVSNGFRTFIEERDFQNVEFQGAWGVSDEDLFRRANREFQHRWDQGTPFFGTVLTVSLHSPWEFPANRAPELPSDTVVPAGFEKKELANFLYADLAIGEFVREAQRLPYFDDTLFVFVGDHGVHLRGRTLLPSEEYRVPALFLSPKHTKPGRIDSVTSQLDIAPTILGMIGGRHTYPFFGRDLLRSDPRNAMALLVYEKRDYGVRRANRLTVLQPEKQPVAYQVASNGSITSLPLTAAHEDDAQDGVALAQMAEELLRSRSFAAESAMPD